MTANALEFEDCRFEIFVPDGTAEEKALARTTHMAVSAHPDDVEFMAYDGILRCHDSADKFFTAVIVGDGAGSPRCGAYADCTDAEMASIRREEQKRAAVIGGYGALIFLNLPSARIKDPNDCCAVDALTRIFTIAAPRVVYTHNPADRHDTHTSVSIRVVDALRRASAGNENSPCRLYGCEVWRDLDWLCDSDKVVFDVGGNDELEASLLSVFDSQIAGGKRYDLAVIGRRRANATFGASHSVDESDRVSCVIDMTEMLHDRGLSVADFIARRIERFRLDVTDRLARLSRN